MAWELGGGQGHMTIMAPIAKRLVQRGHRVMAALKDLSRAKAVMGPIGVELLQAPTKTRPIVDGVRLPHTFAHILHNVGFADSAELGGMVEAWSNLYSLVRPDLMVFEHSPTALVAARGFAARRVVIGTGFFSPPDVYPMPNLRTWRRPDPEKLRADEDRVLQQINRVLQARNQSPIERISQLYSNVRETFLSTFSELDHYPERVGGDYRGAWPEARGETPDWPKGSGKKVFAYLKPFPGLPVLLSRLRELGCPTVVVVDSVSEDLRRRTRCDTLRFETRGLNLTHVAEQCDAAIFNGTHGTTCSMLLGGVPTLQLPIYLEQRVVTEAVARLGAGLYANPENPPEIPARLDTFLGDNRYAEAARRFAEKYSQYDSESTLDEMTDRLEELIADGS